MIHCYDMISLSTSIAFGGVCCKGGSVGGSFYAWLSEAIDCPYYLFNWRLMVLGRISSEAESIWSLFFSEIMTWGHWGLVVSSHTHDIMTAA
jgi:hypothetical protein